MDKEHCDVQKPVRDKARGNSSGKQQKTMRTKAKGLPSGGRGWPESQTGKPRGRKERM